MYIGPKVNSFLCWKYGSNWPFDEKVLTRNLQNNEKRKLHNAIDRQRQVRGIKMVSTDAVVADLSAGFWVSLLKKSYDIPFVWRYNLARIFPHKSNPKRDEMSKICDKVLDLRNRIAHHEPIHHLPLDLRRADLEEQIAAMCPANAAFVRHACTFIDHWRWRRESNLTSETATKQN